MSLRDRIILGYALPAVILLAVGVAVFVAAQAADERADVQAESEEDTVRTLRLANAFETLVSSNRGYIISEDPEFLNDYEAALASARQLAAALDDQLASEASRAALTDAREAIADYHNASIVAHSQVQAGDQEGAFETLRNVSSIAERVRTDLETLIAQERELSEEARARTQSALDVLTSGVIAAVLIGVVGSIAGGTLIASRTTRAIEENATALTSTSSDLASTTAEHERMANQQAAAVSQTTATMTELSSSARQTDEQAREATSRSERALELSEEGADAMRRTLDAVTALRGRMEKMTEEVEELRDETNQIGAVTALVRDIADQTNMLAINASVEAARAGEHGRGFAVVASEIRKLSDESRRSADRIAEHLADIQRSSNGTARVAEEGARTLRDVVELTNRSADAFRGVTEAAKETNERAQQISHSARQQSAAIQQVVEAMEGASAGVRETAAGVRQTKAGIQRIEEVARALRETV